ncbi:MAG: FAD-dependent oxidoreductase, partial [Daejeonella sp.]|nr:FAD-dependent oxidoreductase [Daejeonella sp.]
TILQRSAAILSKQSKDVSHELTKHLCDDGLTIQTETTVNKVWKDGETIKINYCYKGTVVTITASHLLVATGTKPNTDRLKLDKAGVKVDDKEAEQKDIPFQATTLPLTEVPRSIAALDTRGFIKLIRNTETDLLIGARIVAPEGNELAMEISLAIKYKIPVHELVSMFHPYLTLSEGIKLAALSFTMDVHKMSCCSS